MASYQNAVLLATSKKASAKIEKTAGPVVYLVHCEQSLGNEKHTARHYIGYSDKLAGRIWHHRNGTGSKMLRYAASVGIAFRVVSVWLDGSRQLERQLKNEKHAARHCPVCNKRLAAEEKGKAA